MSRGVVTRGIEERSLTSMIPPNTIPKMVGTIGRFNRFEINPNTSKSAAMAQSAIEFRREYTPTKLNRNIAPTA
tara:strand:+ start:2096 stop:2317 length:222 start_codon:yes stop_codon:yes gene_type:complete